MICERVSAQIWQGNYPCILSRNWPDTATFEPHDNTMFRFVRNCLLPLERNSNNSRIYLSDPLLTHTLEIKAKSKVDKNGKTHENACNHRGHKEMRATRIELAYPAWEAGVLPLNYARLSIYNQNTYTHFPGFVKRKIPPLRPASRLWDSSLYATSGNVDFDLGSVLNVSNLVLWRDVCGEKEKSPTIDSVNYS